MEVVKFFREVQELGDTDELLKAASAFFVSEFDPKPMEMIRFIDQYRDRFSVESICQTLKSHRICGFISSRG